MIEFTYDKYIVPYADKDPASIQAPRSKEFVPDQIIEGLASLRRRLTAFEAAYKRRVAGGQPEALKELYDPINKFTKERVFIPDPNVRWEGSIAMVGLTMHRLQPGIGGEFDAMIERSWIEVAKASAPGLSGGSCCSAEWSGHKDGRLATIYMTQDNTINDSVYLAHEGGHYTAVHRRGRREWLPYESWPRTHKLTAEVQAFFFQHAYYDPALNVDRAAPIAKAIDLHRQGEMLGMVRTCSSGLQDLEDIGLLGTELRVKDVSDTSGWIHRYPHGAANFIAAGLYERSKRMAKDEKAEFLSILYPRYEQFPDNDGVPTLEAVFSAGGVNTQAELIRLFREGADSALRPPNTAVLAQRHKRLHAGRPVQP